MSTEVSVFAGSKLIIPIPLPKTSDKDDDPVAISFSNLPSYITLDNVKG